MSLHRTSCGCCEKEIGMTMERTSQYCEHKELFVRVKQLGRSPSKTESPAPPKKRKGMKRSLPKRFWGDARAKVDEEAVCRVCGSNENVEAAHVIGRSSDQPMKDRPNTLYVNPDSIIPLCGPFAQMKCHPQYDAHDLDVLQVLTEAEQIQAVKDAGSIVTAHQRTAPSSFRILREAV